MKYTTRNSVKVLLAILLNYAVFGPIAALAQSHQSFATVYKITGHVVAIDSQTGKQRDLKRGDTLYVGEKVQSSDGAEAVLRTDDAGVIAVRPNAAFVMDQFTANGDSQDKFGVRILTGALRIITGWTGLFNKENHRITTPTATLGIRGTDHEPYVLSADLARQLKRQEGTYNRVYQGGTVLSANGGQVEINPGQVGFAPAARTRALMTTLLPALLEKVPDFFVPGAYDGELQELAQQSMRDARSKHKLPPASDAQAVSAEQPGSGNTSMPAAAEPAAPAIPNAAIPNAATPGEATANTPPASTNSQCDPNAIARTWLATLDDAINKRNPNAFVSQFDAKARITAHTRDAQGQTSEIQFSREEMIKSTFKALSQLTEYSSQRPVINAQLSAPLNSRACNRIEVESVVIESGSRNGSSYRIESLERYKLVRQGKVWRAVEADTTPH